SKGYRVGRVGVDHALDVGSCPHDLRVDGILRVAAAFPFQHLAVPAHEQYLVLADLLKTPAAGFHPNAAPFGIPQGYVAPYKISVVFKAENPASQGDLRSYVVDRVGHGPCFAS